MFAINQTSSFWGIDNKKVLRGAWYPTYYNYVEKDKRVWLIVSDKPVAVIDGETFDLKKVECPIKGMESLLAPCTAKKCHKILA